jgi:CDP-glucose 4,6-dehydratase
MEPLRGYLLVAQKLCEQGPEFGEAWNFGPELSDTKPVEWIVSYLSEVWGEGARWRVDDSCNNPHEAQLLRLDWSKAASRLDWTPTLHLDEALQITTEWYKARLQQADMRSYTLQQIERYSKLSKFSEGAVARGLGTRS